MIERLAQIAQRDVPRETLDRLEAYAALLREESRRQNLVSGATLGSLWDRHVLDSAQLVRLEPFAGASWVDIGSGAGLPGIVIACIVSGPVTLIEPRRLRADFLHKVAESLGLRIAVAAVKAERARGRFDVITARAVTSLARTFEISHHLSTDKSLWVLPKGRSAETELAAARQAWQGVFHVERSVTDPNSGIVIGQGVRAKRR